MAGVTGHIGRRPGGVGEGGGERGVKAAAKIRKTPRRRSARADGARQWGTPVGKGRDADEGGGGA